jgi:UDP-N-acetylglucosamine--N-acetylmuramyl-(pentapeptide) pyrophosphoryl-undecaprenol N-acetylglucosamine transferase
MKKKGNLESLFVCSKRESDAAFLRANGAEFVQITHARRSVSCVWQFPQGFMEGWKLLAKFKPDAVFSKGGAVSLPVCLAAWAQHIPVVLHESDAVMGLSNRLISHFATVCSGFGLPGTLQTGNPVRSMVTKGSRAEGLKITGLKGDRPILLVMGGSQGARSINEAVMEKLDALLAHCDIIHLTGEGKGQAVQREGYFAMPFAKMELPHLYACSTVVLSRAGAGSMSELAAWALPVILVPLEGLAQNHQLRNAQVAAEHHACVLLRQEQLRTDLLRILKMLLDDAPEQKRLGRALQNLLVQDAARLVSEILFKVISVRTRNR